ncbi:DUF3108 domain-containing protein [Nitratiruptor sp. YY09-18]|uniref:DUF3108 domain-containing protein n=1 Tax=Nitratiruptor sp. YY09-18 TaxID=2724901 RepID=UPI001915455E|nr:DUF3108 domain-containing protein [Nitratiruptor sp. YY09-18]BCD67649.1 hypothetical protein NitYY0918_C0549 [Nitratiruptor sp. YY09-18]
MLRTIFILSLFIGFTFAQTIKAKYAVTFGLFGKVATADALLVKKDGNYSIIIDVQSHGLAKMLSHNRREHYESRGQIKNGLFVPHEFVKVKQTTKRRDEKRYIFDHMHKNIMAIEDKNKYGHFHSHTKHLLNYYAKDDLLTLYFNLKKYLKPNRYRYKFYAVGGNEKNGEVDIEVLKNPGRIKKILKVDGLYLRVLLNQKIFASKKGELYVVEGEDGIATKGLLKDVIMFGDIIGSLVSKSIEP